MFQRTVVWGQALQLVVHGAGGLKSPVQRIQKAVGPFIGSRATFAKLLDAESPESLSETERLRAWLLLTAISEDPADWGLGEVEPPPVYDLARLREMCAIRDSNPEPADSCRFWGSAADLAYWDEAA